MTTELKLKADSRLEFAFGRVLPGKEKWMAEEYFGAMGPALIANGFSRLAGAGVLATNVEGLDPVMAVFCSWPTASDRAAFQNDPGFIEIRPARDAALEMSDGHLFDPIDEVIALNTDSDYAVVVSDADNALPDPIFSLPLSDDSPEKAYESKSIALLPWSDAAERLLNGAPEQATVFRVRFEAAS